MNRNYFSLLQERQTNSKHIQFVSGVHALNYWFSTFVWDFLNFMIPTLVIIILLSAFQIEAYTAGENMGYTIVFGKNQVLKNEKINL